LARGLGRAGRTRFARGSGADAGGALIAVGTLMLWAAWLVSVVATGADRGTVPWLALASAAAAVGAAAAVVLVGLLLSDERSWEQRLPGGLLAGVLAASAAYALAGLVPLLLLGLVTGAVYALSSSALRRRFGPAADLALVFAVGGISGALAPGLFGPEGLLAAGVVSGLLTQALGLAAVLALAMWPGH
jgi:ammonia channel protein AmtB